MFETPSVVLCVGCLTAVVVTLLISLPKKFFCPTRSNKGRHVGRQQEIRYTPASTWVHIMRSTADQVPSINELFRKKVVKRIIEVIRPLYALR